MPLLVPPPGNKHQATVLGPGEIVGSLPFLPFPGPPTSTLSPARQSISESRSCSSHLVHAEDDGGAEAYDSQAAFSKTRPQAGGKYGVEAPHREQEAQKNDLEQENSATQSKGQVFLSKTSFSSFYRSSRFPHYHHPIKLAINSQHKF